MNKNVKCPYNKETKFKAIIFFSIFIFAQILLFNNLKSLKVKNTLACTVLNACFSQHKLNTIGHDRKVKCMHTNIFTVAERCVCKVLLAPYANYHKRDSGRIWLLVVCDKFV